MLKISGVLLISSAVSLIGFFCNDKLIKRVRYLESLKRFTLYCSDEMRFGGKQLFNIFSDYKDDNLLFLKEITKDNIMKKDKLKLILDKFMINENDVLAITDFFEKLGSSDIEGQKSHCMYYFELFGSMLIAAQKELNDKGKLYKSLFVFGGLALFILMI